jgi:hypothetical protein
MAWISLGRSDVYANNVDFDNSGGWSFTVTTQTQVTAGGHVPPVVAPFIGYSEPKPELPAPGQRGIRLRD